MMFNRLAVETDGSFRIMHFGYVEPKRNALQSIFSAAVAIIDLEQQKTSLLDYLGKLGPIGDWTDWDPTFNPGNIAPCNVIGASYSGKVGEITLHRYSRKKLAEIGRSETAKRQMNAQAVALLVSETELQKHLIRMLYPQGE